MEPVSSYLLVNSLRVHYLLWNRDGGDQALVCHHGLASNARIWELMAPHLANGGTTVYAPDARGHGLTDKPDTGYDIETITDDLAGFIEICRLERPWLAGHSWGANVALNYAARYAIGPRAPAGIILIDGGMTEMNERGLDWPEMEKRLRPPRLAGMPVDEFMRRLREWNADWGASDQALSIYLNSFDVSEDDRISPRLTLERHMQIARSLWDFKTYTYFERVRCPVLLLPSRPKATAGDGDQEYLSMKDRGVARAQAALRQVRVHWMDDTIHDSPLQRPQELAEAILEFIRQ